MVIFPMKVAANRPSPLTFRTRSGSYPVIPVYPDLRGVHPEPRHLAPIPKRVCPNFKRDQSAQNHPLFSTTSNIPFPQPLSFDIDGILPRGWGGMTRFALHAHRPCTPVKRIPAQFWRKSPLCFQQLPNCLFNKPFPLTFIQIARGGGGV